MGKRPQLAPPCSRRPLLRSRPAALLGSSPQLSPMLPAFVITCNAAGHAHSAPQRPGGGPGRPGLQQSSLQACTARRLEAAAPPLNPCASSRGGGGRGHQVQRWAGAGARVARCTALQFFPYGTRRQPAPAVSRHCKGGGPWARPAILARRQQRRRPARPHLCPPAVADARRALPAAQTRS